MARIRTIKPTFFSSLTIAALPIPTRITFVGLWCYVDDEGRGVDDARLVKADVWPLDDGYTVRKIEADLVLLTERGLIERYEAGGRRYLRVVNSKEHQRINRPQPSKLPPPPERTDRSVNGQGAHTATDMSSHGTGADDSPPERKGRERNNPPNPPPSGGDHSPHDGRHANCRDCGTNRRGPSTPTMPGPQPPVPPSISDVIAKRDATPRDPAANQTGISTARSALHPNRQKATS